MLKLFFTLALICVLVPLSQAQCAAPRIRRSWQNLNRAEQELYVEAVLLLKTQGGYDQFVNMHTSSRTMDYAHGASGFLPWHRWYLWKFEEALRALGPKYQCITVPYWTWEREAATRRQSSILGNLFGTYMANVPNPDVGQCVRDGRFSRNFVPTDGQNCLMRAFDDGPQGMGFAGETEVAGYITGLTNYGGNAGFRATMEGLVHAAPHVWVGGHMGAFGSPNDPLFFLHHCNVDRIWSLWQDCHDYDRVDYSTAAVQNRAYPWFVSINAPGIRDGPLDPMPYAFDDGQRDNRYWQGLPAGQAHPLPIDMMRIMGNRRIPTLAYTYDPADSLKGILDRTGARCNWHWFVTPNAILPDPNANNNPPKNNTNGGGATNNTNPGGNPVQPAAPVCGNGIVENGEQCDQGPARRCSPCGNCRVLCGNGVVDCGEDCDDGNRLDGDSCPANCRRNHVWRRVRSDLTLKRANGEIETVFDAETNAYISGEISWEDYLFKRSTTEEQKSVYSNIIRVKTNNNDEDSNHTAGGLGRLNLKRTQGTPLSSYLIFGKAAEPPKQWSNPQMEKLGSSVCEHNPLTKFAHAKAKLRMLTYVEAEMEGCRKRASPKWIAMIKRMNASDFQPPCKGTQCCKIADMVSEKMVCDGGGVAVPSCNIATCTWQYDCSNATLDDDDDDNHNATGTKPKPSNVTVASPRSIYRKYAALGSDDSAFATADDDGTARAALSGPAKIGIGVGAAVGLLVVVVLVVVVSSKVGQKSEKV